MGGQTNTNQIIPGLTTTFLNSWLNWFALIERLGCLCAICCCCEGSTVLYILGGMDVLSGAYSAYAAYGLTALVTVYPGKAVFIYICCVFQFIQGLLTLFIGVALIRVAGTPKDQRRADLQK